MFWFTGPYRNTAIPGIHVPMEPKTNLRWKLHPLDLADRKPAANAAEQALVNMGKADKQAAGQKTIEEAAGQKTTKVKVEQETTEPKATKMKVEREAINTDELSDTEASLSDVSLPARPPMSVSQRRRARYKKKKQELRDLNKSVAEINPTISNLGSSRRKRWKAALRKKLELAMTALTSEAGAA